MSKSDRQQSRQLVNLSTLSRVSEPLSNVAQAIANMHNSLSRPRLSYHVASLEYGINRLLG